MVVRSAHRPCGEREPTADNAAGKRFSRIAAVSTWLPVFDGRTLAPGGLPSPLGHAVAIEDVAPPSQPGRLEPMGREHAPPLQRARVQPVRYAALTPASDCLRRSLFSGTNLVHVERVQLRRYAGLHSRVRWIPPDRWGDSIPSFHDPAPLRRQELDSAFCRAIAGSAGVAIDPNYGVCSLKPLRPRTTPVVPDQALNPGNPGVLSVPITRDVAAHVTTAGRPARPTRAGTTPANEPTTTRPLPL